MRCSELVMKIMMVKRATGDGGNGDQTSGVETKMDTKMENPSTTTVHVVDGLLNITSSNL